MRETIIVIGRPPDEPGLDMGASIDLMVLIGARWPNAKMANVAGAVMAFSVDLDDTPTAACRLLLEEARP